MLKTNPVFVLGFWLDLLRFHVFDVSLLQFFLVGPCVLDQRLGLS